MADMNDIVRIAVDAYRGNVAKYSVDESMEVLRNALIEANGGSSTLDYRRIRDGKCPGLFSLIETILSRTVPEGLQGDEYFNALVDFRNVAEGDQNVFETEDGDSMFSVAEAANGTQAIRRQRLGGVHQIAVPTKFHVVKFYEELNRVLAGRVDMNHMIDKLAASMHQNLLNDIYTLWASATAEDFGGAAYFPVAGAYDEDTTLETIAHVEAAAGGRPATIVGTKAALRKLNITAAGEEAKSDMYNFGYYGKFFGTPAVALPQRHKVGTTDFVMDDTMITIIAGDDKPLKVVYEGDSLIIPGAVDKNQDLTQDYLYGDKYGTALILAGGNSGIGRIKINA